MTDVPSRPDTRAQRLARIAGGQDGIVDLADAARAGLTGRAASRWAATGHLHRVHQGVYAVGHAGLTPRGLAVAALKACGSHDVLSHASSAALWDVADWPAVPHVTGATRRTVPGIRYHEATTPPPWTLRHDLPTTTVEALVLDLAEDPGDLPVFRILNELLYRRRTTVDRVEAHLVASPGRHGIPVVRALLPHAGRRHSRLEDDFHHLLAQIGVPRPRTNERVHGLEVDFWWPAERVIVETDGWAAHGTRTRFESDRDRDAALLAAGIVTMRVTAHMMTGRPMLVGARLGAILLSRK